MSDPITLMREAAQRIAAIGPIARTLRCGQAVADALREKATAQPPLMSPEVAGSLLALDIEIDPDAHPWSWTILDTDGHTMRRGWLDGETFYVYTPPAEYREWL